MSSRSECGEYYCVPTGGMAPLSWRFSRRLVSVSTSSGILNSSVWEKSTVGRIMAFISPSKTSCMVCSFMMCSSSSSVLTKLVGEF